MYIIYVSHSHCKEKYICMLCYFKVEINYSQSLNMHIIRQSVVP